MPDPDEQPQLPAHELINPDSMAPARGFAHIVVPSDGRTVYLAGQIGCDSNGAMVDGSFAAQYHQALANVVEALEAVGGEPEHIVSLVVFTSSMEAYRNDLPGIGAAHRANLGRHYPAMAMLGVTELFERDAMVEVVATAVIPAK